MADTRLTLRRLFGERPQFDAPMKGFTTLGIGGPAVGLIAARTDEDLAAVVRLARAEGIDLLLVGGGSNLLVADEGVDALLVKNEVRGIGLDGDILSVKAGTRLQDLVDFSLTHGLDGLHRLTGIPGTVGGAVYGNAGAYGQTISDHLEEVVCFDGSKVIALAKSECAFAYRHSAFKANRFAILEARLRLRPGDAGALASEAQGILTQRLAKYPVGLKCPGSFFKNVLVEDISPDSLRLVPREKVIYGKVPAGYLLEQVGAKGQRRGDIVVADVNANLFVNLGNGTATDFVQLASEQAAKVYEKYGIELSPEVQLINLPPLRVKS